MTCSSVSRPAALREKKVRLGQNRLDHVPAARRVRFDRDPVANGRHLPAPTGEVLDAPRGFGQTLAPRGDDPVHVVVLQRHPSRLEPLGPMRLEFRVAALIPTEGVEVHLDESKLLAGFFRPSPHRDARCVQAER